MPIFAFMETLSTQLAILMVRRRKELNIKQEDFSEMTGIAIRTIRDLEKGKGNPSLDTISKLMNVLGIQLLFKLRNE